MKHAALAAFLLCVGFMAPANAADSPKVYCTTQHGITTFVFSGAQSISVPAQLAQFVTPKCTDPVPSFDAAEQTITGKVMTPYEKSEFQLASIAAGDLQGNGTAGMLYNSDSALYVVNDPSFPLTATISGAISLGSGAAQIGRLSQIVPQYSGANLQTGCTSSPNCVWTVTTNIGTLYSIINAGPSMISTQTLTCYDNASNTGTVILYTSQLGNGQVWVPAADLGLKLTSNKVTCQIAGSVLVGNIIVNGI